MEHFRSRPNGDEITTAPVLPTTYNAEGPATQALAAHNRALAQEFAANSRRLLRP